jgi:drug/metabolite transporter (DMT)-like permease
MLWPFLAFLSSLFDAGYYATIKKFFKGINANYLAAGWFFISSSILFIISYVRGFPVLQKGFAFAVAMIVVLNIASVFLYLKAVQNADLSLVMPFLAFTPLFLLFTSFLLLGEIPSFQGVVGVVLIVVGSLVLVYQKSFFAYLAKSKGVWYMLLVAFLFGISTIYEKVVTQTSDPFFGSATVQAFLFLFFFCFALIKSPKIFKEYPRLAGPILLVALLLVSIAVSVNFAYLQGPVSYVIAIKRMSILWSVIFGALVFKEKSFLQRIIGAAVMLAGVVLIFFG